MKSIDLRQDLVSQRAGTEYFRWRLWSDISLLKDLGPGPVGHRASGGRSYYHAAMLLLPKRLPVSES